MGLVPLGKSPVPLPGRGDTNRRHFGPGAQPPGLLAGRFCRMRVRGHPLQRRADEGAGRNPERSNRTGDSGRAPGPPGTPTSAFPCSRRGRGGQEFGSTPDGPPQALERHSDHKHLTPSSPTVSWRTPGGPIWAPDGPGRGAFVRVPSGLVPGTPRVIAPSQPQSLERAGDSHAGPQPGGSATDRKAQCCPRIPVSPRFGVQHLPKCVRCCRVIGVSSPPALLAIASVQVYCWKFFSLICKWQISK